MAAGYLVDYVERLPVALALIAIAIAFVLAAWVVRNLTTPQDDHAVLRQGNLAIAVERGGFVVGHVLAMAFALTSFEWSTPWVSVGAVALKFAITSGLLLALLPLVDWAVLPKVHNNDLLLAGNVAVGTVMAMVYVALGVVAGAATVGATTSLVVSLTSTIVFAVAGVAVVLAVTRLHVAVTHRGDDTPERLRRGEFAPALELGAVVLALGQIMAVGVAGDLVTWVDGLSAFAATCVIGLVVLVATQWLVNRLMTRGSSGSQVRREGNLAMVAVVAFGRVAVGLLVAVLLWRVI